MPARVLVVGLDAVDPQVVRELAGAGRMPNVAALLAGAPGLTVRNPDGFYTGAVWPTLVTGVSPGRHARLCPSRFRPGTYQMRPFHPRDLAWEPLWAPLARAGRRVALLDVPHTQADPELDVTHLVEWGAHDARWGFHTWPESLADEVMARFGPHPVDDCDAYAIEGGAGALVTGLVDGIARKTALTRSLLDRADWDLFFVVFGEGHCVGHQCWHVHDPDHPRHDPAVAATDGDPLARVYEALDRALGDVLAGVGQDSHVLVLLSHGMGPHYAASFLFPDILLRLERAQNRTPTLPATAKHALRRLTNRAAQHLGLRRGVWLLGGSRAFFRLPNAAPCAGIRVNVVGREPSGVVAPGTEYEQLCRALEAEFLALENVDTGTPAVRRVLRPAELFEGPAVGAMPDLLVEWDQSHPIRSLASPTIGRVDGEYRGQRTGDHRRDGMLLGRPASLPTTAEETTDARDLAPTIGALLDVPLTEVGELRVAQRGTR